MILLKVVLANIEHALAGTVRTTDSVARSQELNAQSVQHNR